MVVVVSGDRPRRPDEFANWSNYLGGRGDRWRCFRRDEAPAEGQSRDESVKRDRVEDEIDRERERERERTGRWRSRGTKHNVLECASLVVERGASRDDDAVIVDVADGGGLPEHVHVQVEERERVGRVRESRPQGTSPRRQGGDPGAGSVEQSSGQSAAGMLSRARLDQSATTVPE